MEYKKIIDLISDNEQVVEFADYGNGVSLDWIERAQNRLNVKFPPSYIWWLKNYGGGEINGDEIYSIYEIDFDNVVGGDIVYINELNQKNGLTDINELVIQENDQGDIYYFNLKEANENDEYPVYNKLNKIKYADNFIEFLKKKITE